MTITNVHIFNVGSSDYDMRKATYWHPCTPQEGNPSTELMVRFLDSDSTVLVNKSNWETAKGLSLAASGG